MATYALTGNDTLTIDNRVFKDFADGATISITFPNEKTGETTGKNSNTIFATNEQGKNVNVELRILAGSSDDIYLNGRSIDQDRDLPTFVLLTGTFSKRIGDGQGNVHYINYSLKGGVFKNGIDGNENLQGETEQGIAIYRLFFAEGERAIL